MRLYLMDSPLVKGQSLKFDEEKSLPQKIREVFLPLYNSYRFLIQNIHRYEKSSNKQFVFNKDFLFSTDLNITDKWIIAYEQRLIKFLHQEMESYRLYTVVSELLGFLDKLTNWYIRLNRGRVKGDFGEDDCLKVLNILFITMLNLIILFSPFIPFITEFIYQNLRNGLDQNSPLLDESIHFLRIPEYDDKLLDNKIEEIMNNMISVIELGRKLREKKKIPLKKPVSSLSVINFNQQFLNNIKEIENFVIEELNTNDIKYINEESKYIKLSIKPNYENLYKRCKEIKDTMITEQKENDPELKAEEAQAKKEANDIGGIITKLSEDEIKELLTKKEIKKNDVTITSDQIAVEKKFLPQYEKDKVNVCLSNSDCGILINTETNEEINNAFISREIINRIQRLRKESGIQIQDEIIVAYSFKEEAKASSLVKVSQLLKDSIEKVIRYSFVKEIPKEGYNLHKSDSYEIGENKEIIDIAIYKKIKA